MNLQLQSSLASIWKDIQEIESNTDDLSAPITHQEAHDTLVSIYNTLSLIIKQMGSKSAL